MEVLKTGEAFPIAPAPRKAIYTIVVFKQEDQIYTARFNGRCASKTDIKFEALEHIVKLDKTEFEPEYLGIFTQAKPTDQVYVKRPHLVNYYPINDTNRKRIADEVLQEVKVCEKLKLKPHPNIAEYIGCKVDDGKISGICFKQYKETLQQKLNPGHLNKREFARSSRLDAAWCSGIIQGIRNGLDHLHALGLVHNDITPANIIVDEHDTPVIIDFGSCRANGESLRGVGRTYEWYDHEVKIANPSNDLDALAEMEAWMFGRVDDFKFAERTV